MTTQVGIKELRDGLSRYVGDVHETGRALIITDRGKPIAKLVPLEPWDERYARLVAEGAITPPSKPLHDRCLVLRLHVSLLTLVLQAAVGLCLLYHKRSCCNHVSAR